MNSCRHRSRCCLNRCSFAGLLLVLCAGCRVVDTTTVAVGAPTEGANYPATGRIGCHSDLGAYRLPETLLQVRIEAEYSPGTGTIENYGYEVMPVVRGSRHAFCLDYHSNPLSKDTIKIKRATQGNGNQGSGQGLLQLVSSNAVDFTGIVIRKLTRAFFVARSGNAGFQMYPGRAAYLEQQGADTQKYRAVDLEFDPLDRKAVAEANDRLRHFGLCLTLGEHTYDTARWDVQSYCDNPVDSLTHLGWTDGMTEPKYGTRATKLAGVAYRPKLSYGLYVYGKTDPTGPEPWVLKELKEIALENRAPVLVLRVKGAIFAQRRTVIAFENGALTGFCVSKSAEGAGFVEVPVEIIRSIVALPTQILQVRIDQTNGQAELNAIHRQIIDLQKKTNSICTGRSDGSKRGGVRRVQSLPGRRFSRKCRKLRCRKRTRV